ncbi:MAG: YfjP family GTPase, partial [Actinomycetota bacterium]|nr:YfjP family GTPase [Actinomycetota bacterium]
MSPLVAGSRTLVGPPRTTLIERARQIGTALELGGAQMVSADADDARSLVQRVEERITLGGDHTVVVLAGATGSGKSSLFNAVTGADLAEVGVRRPTTSTATAAVWGPKQAGPLLDWLEIDTRHGLGPTARDDGVFGSLDGLVLLDLPDTDSRERHHRAEVERVLQLCDVFVWVTDPQKYADAVLHEGYLHQLSAHEAATVIVLNQVDRLEPSEAGACRADLVRLLQHDGLSGSCVVTTSARTGQGVPELRQRLANAVAGGSASRHRLGIDLDEMSTRLRRSVGDTEAVLAEGPDGGLVLALSRAAGVPVVLQAVVADFKRSSLARTGWLFTRWRRHLHPDPLGRLRLAPGTFVIPEVDSADVRAVLGRSSLPAPSPAARSAVRLATRELTDRAAVGLPPRWARAVAERSSPDRTRLEEHLDRAVTHTPLRAPDPLWWRVTGVLQWLLGVIAVAGGLWLLALFVVAWFRLPDLPTLSLGPVPVAVPMLGLGLLLGLGLAGLARVLSARGAVRRRALVAERLETAICAVAEEQLVAPTRAVLL